MAITSMVFEKQVFAPGSTFGGMFIIGDRVYTFSYGGTSQYTYTYPDLTYVSTVTIPDKNSCSFGTDEFNKKLYAIKPTGLYELNVLDGSTTPIILFTASGQVDQFSFNQCAIHNGLGLISFVGYQDNRLAFFDLATGTLLANINHGIGTTTFLSFAYKRLFIKGRTGTIYSSQIVTRSNLSSLTFSPESACTGVVSTNDLPSGSFHQKYGKVAIGGYGNGSVNLYNIQTDYAQDSSNLFLFKIGSNVSKYNGSALEVVGTYPPTKDLFVQSNVSSMDSLNKTVLSQVDQVLVYNENSTSNVGFIPTQNKVIVKSTSTSFSDVENIDSITMTSSANVKFFISSDNGLTWYSYYNDSWNTNDLNVSNLETYGMTSTIFNSLNDKFNQLLLNASLSFAFLLTDSTSNVDLISFQSDMKGSWYGTTDETSTQKNFKITYSSNENIKISFYVSGTYKVNY